MNKSITTMTNDGFFGLMVKNVRYVTDLAMVGYGTKNNSKKQQNFQDCMRRNLLSFSKPPVKNLNREVGKIFKLALFKLTEHQCLRSLF
ncbi:hypothetical protein [Argonema galeatum]|uniref:hypothetical protein n=1 Tax=Argonema galeatum TaxID=2942762 RepID=UPI0020131A8E|nr:hypothetical protein [Argonema galeatum]MCL1464210.1 hypothetical protein [Argonema galeatum A003/A1]